VRGGSLGAGTAAGAVSLAITVLTL
jgi:hypothetical protein